MKSLKEKALDKILLGAGFKLIPLGIYGSLIETYPDLSDSSDSVISFVLPLLILILLLVGYVIFVKGCFLYLKSKGYSSKWGWLGILSLLIFPILLFIPSKRDTSAVQPENSENTPFYRVNIPEIFLLWITSHLLIYSISLIFISLDDWESILIENYLYIISEIVYFIVFIVKIKESKLDLNKIIGQDKSINLKSILVITIMDFALNRGLNSLTLYQLSFIFPRYVENFINDRSYTNLLEMLLWAVSAILLAPLMEEFFFRGLALQRWVMKWGIKTAIIASSLFFALVHFRYDIISLFIGGLILSILYIKTHNLISSIICHFCYNTLVVFFSFINFISLTENERNAFITIESYQDYTQGLLSQRIFLIAVSVPFIIHFIYKNFPRNDAVIPYYANAAKISETD
ncbi:MAG: type II CAAX endopeptidase family protein [Cyanobacteria bacterium J06592_8]